MPALLAARSLGRRFGSQWVFRNVEFDLWPGQCLAVAGANGSGKSTLLKIMAGLVSPSAGELDRHQLEPARTKIGYAAPDFGLFPSSTAREILVWSSVSRGLPTLNLDVLDDFGIGELIDKPARILSTGQRSRLRMAIAIQASPPLLLLDEPTANLDDDGRALVAEVVRRQGEWGACVLATNDERDFELCDGVLRLDA